MTKAEEIARQLGKTKLDDAEWVKNKIARLNKKSTVALEQIKELHDWLDGKRKSRRSCCFYGKSRTGKTVACKSYELRNPPIKDGQKTPIFPVVYIMPPPKCGIKSLYQEIMDSLKYRAVKGLIDEVRKRGMEVLKGCQVETLIIDEANRLKPDTLTDVRDIGDKLEISVVLVGTDRLKTLLKSSEEVYGRFRAHRRFTVLEGKEFTKTVAIWEERVLNLPVASNLTTKESLKTLLEATEGYIGRLDELLREAAIASLSQGHKKVDHQILKEIAREYS